MTLSIVLAPSDTIHVELRNVTHSTSGAITSGLTGSVSIFDAGGSSVAGPASLANISGSTWGANIAAPSTKGTYAIAVTFDAAGAHRTISGALTLQ